MAAWVIVGYGGCCARGGRGRHGGGGRGLHAWLLRFRLESASDAGAVRAYHLLSCSSFPNFPGVMSVSYVIDVISFVLLSGVSIWAVPPLGAFSASTAPAVHLLVAIQRLRQAALHIIAGQLNEERPVKSPQTLAVTSNRRHEGHQHSSSLHRAVPAMR